jgi:hypothetical protein
MTERDGAWMARLLARFTPELVRALAEVGRFSDPRDTDHVAQVLEERLQFILRRYLTRLSPLGDLAMEAPDRLCATDMAEARAVRPPEAFAYRAWMGSTPLAVERPRPARVCVSLPRLAGDGGPADDAPSRYVRLDIADGVAERPLAVYLYDLGPSRGYRLAGVER